MPPKKRTTKKPKKLVAATLAPAVSASKKTEKKQTKSAATPAPAKKQKKEYIDVNALDDNGDEVQQNGGILKPNMHTFLHIQKKFLRLKIQLHKVPPQLINLDMKADKFHVDTLQYTRKYQADEPYYGGVSVDVEKAEAKWEMDTLNIVVPVTNIPEQVMEKESKILEQKRAAKNIKFPAPVKKVVTQYAKKVEKKQAQRQRKRARESYAEQGMDLPAKKRRLMTSAK